jgi:hypothetical protein
MVEALEMVEGQESTVENCQRRMTWIIEFGNFSKENFLRPIWIQWLLAFG